MNYREELLSNFESLGVTVTDGTIEKCTQLCEKYDVTAEDLCDQWFAYAATNLKGAEPTIASLEAMERKEYAKYNKQVARRSVSTPTSATVRAAAQIQTTPKRNLKRSRSPENKDTDIPQSHHLNSPSLNVSTTAYSPSVSYRDRKTKGNVVTTFGPEKLRNNATFKTVLGRQVELRLWGDQEGWLSTEVRYMYEVLGRKAEVLNGITNWLGEALKEKYFSKECAFAPFERISLTPVVTYGRICCDGEGKLNSSSVLLEGCSDLNKGATLSLNLSKLQTYSIFPGQVVVTQGTNVTGSQFVAQSLHTDATYALPPAPEKLQQLQEPLQIVAAAGPFTVSDNLLYEPLEDLIKYVVEHKPHVLLLIGPIVDASHQEIVAGNTTDPFDVFFEHLIDNFMIKLKDVSVEVVLVASAKEAHHHNVYPTPPYTISKKYKNLHCYPDPCTININGVVVGITSADILFHLGKQDCSSQSVDRMATFSRYILGQRSFYPLYPPDASMNVDHDLLDQFGMLQNTPHVLLLPSSFNGFIKNVSGCIVINPERLTKGYVAGTFARLEIHATEVNSLSNDAVCQIVRI